MDISVVTFKRPDGIQTKIGKTQCIYLQKAELTYIYIYVYGTSTQTHTDDAVHLSEDGLSSTQFMQ